MQTYTENLTASIIQLPFEPLPNIYAMNTDDSDLEVALPPPSVDDAVVGVINIGSGAVSVIGTLQDGSTHELSEQYQTTFFIADAENQVWRISSEYGAPADGGIKRYVALLSQSGEDAPVATVLESTLSDEVVWTRESTGNYLGSLTGEWTLNKTTVFIASPTGITRIFTASRGSVDDMQVQTGRVDFLGMDVQPEDGNLNVTAIEICVYP